MFEGGDPAISGEQNSVVGYTTAGLFDVELTVTTASASNTLLMEDYITVYSLPAVTLDPFDDVCVQWPSFALTGGLPEGGIYSGPGVSGGMFDPAAAGLGTHEIAYFYTDGNGCTNGAAQTILVDPCTGIPETTPAGISIFPNPSHGMITISGPLSGQIDIRISDLTGQTVWKTAVMANDGGFANTFDLEHLPEGMYLLQVNSGERTVTSKLHLIR
ncbi:MAG: T9SS type A sorting domain-containing protein [Bacteroidales bacterium]|nr:T9SS type A sorting domain-containing protein [Bacteroidales bacterium]